MFEGIFYAYFIAVLIIGVLSAAAGMGDDDDDCMA